MCKGFMADSTENKKIISVVIPYHSESLQDIAPMLRSLNEQVGIDFNTLEILMCKDTEEKNKIDTYSFSEYENLKGRIKRFVSPHSCNPGMSRQIALDHAEGEYVFFCDADDALYTLGTLRSLYENIEKTHADVYRFNFIEEVGSFFGPQLVYDSKPVNWVWVFAKAYKIEFLRAHNVRFEPNIRWHEDTYFNLLCRYSDPVVIDIQMHAYLWKFNKKSITRLNNHEYTFNAIADYLYASNEAFKKITKEYHKNCTLDILRVINKYYKVLLDPKNRTQPKYNEIEKCYYNFVRGTANSLFNGLPEDFKKAIAQLPVSPNDTNPSISLEDYLKSLRNKYLTVVKK